MQRFRDGVFGSDGSVYGLCWLRHIKAKANKRGDWIRDKTCRDKIRVVRWLQDGACKAMVPRPRMVTAEDTVKELLLSSWNSKVQPSEFILLLHSLSTSEWRVDGDERHDDRVLHDCKCAVKKSFTRLKPASWWHFVSHGGDGG
ncbi:hypothetical protein E2542_SST16843 [Spatholobus suberectus]|nr:hypothetical protein E2542_SST16843 [Spatholobus suberectus]